MNLVKLLQDTFSSKFHERISYSKSLKTFTLKIEPDNTFIPGKLSLKKLSSDIKKTLYMFNINILNQEVIRTRNFGNGSRKYFVISFNVTVNKRGIENMLNTEIKKINKKLNFVSKLKDDVIL